ncbi:YcbK family protein [Undibacterium oligocarboniphilum]|uniref:Murein endopeptidase K n=1 Tax=Undibacterium oligocarboniphilum TaxID=666702 RepID=A0A850QH89_9BURK|nr:DUF882 domain-containing protein [Undibacterium oligocarboniphilum]MBC3871473.1 DUF882 domain-containing protein [Undibacterium oligocarboniphilum]NVO78951.1 DUF882 domain-containing protein [Undibacterium oligocarboniphilum]
MQRREFLKAMLIGCSSLGRPAVAQENRREPSVIWMSRGNEQYQFDIATQAGYLTAAYLLRDIRANRQGYPDIRLLKTVAWMQAWLALYGHHVRIDALSGLRTRETNQHTEKAAQNSCHLPDGQGVFRAIDFRTQTIPSDYLGKLAGLLKQGGVGIYQRNFIHIDTGAVIGHNGLPRIWTGA